MDVDPVRRSRMTFGILLFAFVVAAPARRAAVRHAVAGLNTNDGEGAGLKPQRRRQLEEQRRQLEEQLRRIELQLKPELFHDRAAAFDVLCLTGGPAFLFGRLSPEAWALVAESCPSGSVQALVEVGLRLPALDLRCQAAEVLGEQAVAWAVRNPALALDCTVALCEALRDGSRETGQFFDLSPSFTTHAIKDRGLWELRVESVRQLGRIATADGQMEVTVRTAVEGVVQALADADGDVFTAAAGVFAEIASAHRVEAFAPRAAAALVEASSSGEHDPGERSAAVHALGSIARADCQSGSSHLKAVRGLFEASICQVLEVREAAVEELEVVLAACGTGAISHEMFTLVVDQSRSGRAEAIRVLELAAGAACGKGAWLSSAVGACVEVLSDGAPRAQAGAAEALGKIAAACGSSALSDEAVAKLLAVAKATTGGAGRSAALIALGHLARAVVHDDPPVGARTAHTGRWPLTVGILVDALSDSSQWIRISAAGALNDLVAHCGADELPAKVIDSLATVLHEHEDEEIRRFAAVVLYNALPVVSSDVFKRAADFVTEDLFHEHAEVREQAAKLLGKATASVAMVRAFHEGCNVSVRARAAAAFLNTESLAMPRGIQEEAVHLLADAARHEEEGVREISVRALGCALRNSVIKEDVLLATTFTGLTWHLEVEDQWELHVEAVDLLLAIAKDSSKENTIRLRAMDALADAARRMRPASGRGFHKKNDPPPAPARRWRGRRHIGMMDAVGFALAGM
mmetsp:Transcript_37699/g.108412  ORF Transcript_37699/g.108412 Transcript_37699/m.108412 type:complete len:750 (+) Transcript_37699:42-2291(+)